MVTESLKDSAKYIDRSITYFQYTFIYKYDLFSPVAPPGASVVVDTFTGTNITVGVQWGGSKVCCYKG